MSETIIVPKAITVALEAYRQAVHRKAVAMMTPGSDAGRADAQRAVEFAYSDVIYAMRVALAAPAEGPERAATGETGYYVGVDADGQKVRVANNVRFTDSRKRKRAAGEETGA